ncbi:NAD(P)/FAD-dependent oxidoreductase [Lichenifustis flavocetrariae]|uniref:FAD-binding oxidoreductase n=1 Tax=Lichenifustis flavocetrariae TaxID=2949735 RepID=A0AA42CLR5_9HYPH|nr:FAD-binding oxidoreductase [Lichenifustis flavocetrariae]MCW6507580.1 FAD-binding oxidoreductase [Lichenifustis flavocetrariae]
MTGYVDSYYARTLNEFRRYPALDGDLDVETVVIGGGLAGTATALDLAERGHRVALVEARRIGWGASGRNGGFASSGMWGGYKALAARVGLDEARRFLRVAQGGLALVRQRIADYAIACGPLQEGSLECNIVGANEDLIAHRDYMAEVFDVPSEYWPKDRLRAALATTRYTDALFTPDTMALHPLNFAAGMGRACAERGVSVFEETPVLGFTSARGRKSVRTTGGRILADRIVIAGGGYVRGLNRTVSGGTIPIASFVMTTEPLGAHLRDAIRVPYAISDNLVALNYYRPLADTRLLWGGRVQVWEPRPARIAELLRRDMVRFYPALRDAKVEVAWGGMMPYTRHRLPVIGQIAPDVWYTTGFGGLGLTLTTAVGRLISQAIVERDDTWRMFERLGLPYAGGRLGKVPAQIYYWGHQVRAALGRPAVH